MVCEVVRVDERELVLADVGVGREVGLAPPLLPRRVRLCGACTHVSRAAVHAHVPHVHGLRLRDGELREVCHVHALEHLKLPHAALRGHGRRVAALCHVIVHAVLREGVELLLELVHAPEQVGDGGPQLGYLLLQLLDALEQVLVVVRVGQLHDARVQPPNLLLRRAHVLERLALPV